MISLLFSLFIYGALLTAIEVEGNKSKDQESETTFWKKTDMSGMVYIKAFKENSFYNQKTSNLYLKEFDWTTNIKVNPLVETYFNIMFDQEENNNDLTGNHNNFYVDELYVTAHPWQDSPIFFRAGHMLLPFSYKSSYMITKTLTEKLSETYETAALFGVEWEGLMAQGYIFRGEGARKIASNSALKNFGARLSYEGKFAENTIHLGGNFISDIAETDTVQGALIGDTEAGTPVDRRYNLLHHVAGYSAFADYSFNGFNAVVEYVQAARKFASRDVNQGGQQVRPEVYSAEVGFNFNLLEKDHSIAVGYARSKQSLPFNMPESRMLLSYSIHVLDASTITLEQYNDKDYSEADGGTGKKAFKYSALWKTEF